MKYRREIDGLRGIAVIPVILFHAGFELFSGGFVGVDVFFVISGYLITNIIIEDLERKQFNLVNFYERRARRILPALFFVMICCIPISWIWMLPNEMRDFSQSLVAVSLFFSNILFWKKTGYFFQQAEEIPLLHTWSLAVEEQFYILFPIFLILIWSIGKNKVFWVIFFIAVISFLLSEWGWRNNSVANFYLTPTRAWELLAGCISAFIVQRIGIQKNNTLASLGFIAIVFAIFIYNEDTPFPSIYTLVPVVGVVLLIIYADKDTLATKILSSRLLVGVGLISYSAYLWHQPLFAFTRIRLFGEVNTSTIILIFFLTLLLAGITYKYIEQPFRAGAGKKILKKNVLFILLSSFTLLMVFGLIGQMSNGFIDRKKFDDIKQFQILKKESVNWVGICQSNSINVNNFKGHTCIIGDKKSTPKGLLWGDSFAGSALFGIDKFLSQKGESYLAVITDGCPPLPGISRSDRRFNCIDNHHQKVVDWFINQKNLSELIWIGNYRQLVKEKKSLFYLDGKEPNQVLVEKIIKKTSKNLIENNKEVIFVLEGPIFLVDVAKYISKKNIMHENIDPKLLNVKVSEQRNQIGLTPTFFKNIDGIDYIDSLEVFCNKETCSALMKDGSPLVDAGGHFYNKGSSILAKEIFLKLE